MHIKTSFKKFSLLFKKRKMCQLQKKKSWRNSRWGSEINPILLPSWKVNILFTWLPHVLAVSRVAECGTWVTSRSSAPSTGSYMTSLRHISTLLTFADDRSALTKTSGFLSQMAMRARKHVFLLMLLCLWISGTLVYITLFISVNVCINTQMCVRM